jgi:hypothetical protein
MRQQVRKSVSKAHAVIKTSIETAMGAYTRPDVVYVRTSDTRIIDAKRDTSAFVMLCTPEDKHTSGPEAARSGSFVQYTFLGGEPDSNTHSRGKTAPAVAPRREPRTLQHSGHGSDYAAAAAPQTRVQENAYGAAAATALPWPDDDFECVSKDEIPADPGAYRNNGKKGGHKSGFWSWGNRKADKSKPAVKPKPASSAPFYKPQVAPRSTKPTAAGAPQVPPRSSKPSGSPSQAASGGYPPAYNSVTAGGSVGGQGVSAMSSSAYSGPISPYSGASRHVGHQGDRSFHEDEVRGLASSFKLVLFYVKPLAGGQVIATPLNVDQAVLKQIDARVLGRDARSSTEFKVVLRRDDLSFLESQAECAIPALVVSGCG